VSNIPPSIHDEDRITLHEQIRRELARSPVAATTNTPSPFVETSIAPPGSSHILYKELSYAIGGAVIDVHRHLGPGQIEANYERALAQELTTRGIPFRRQVPIDSFYKGELVGEFVVDMIVNDQIILELKSVVQLHQVHGAQLLSYLRATGLRLGLLINFNEAVVWNGIKRIVC
jgi:GxxExxY protein